MPSLSATLTNFYLRKTVRNQPLHLMDPKDVREQAERFAIKRPPKNITIEEIESPVKGEWQRWAGAPSGKVLYYLHGGGYVFGSPLSHRMLTFAIIKEVGVDVFALDYRLAPEHPFPAAVDDALAGYQYLLEKYDPSEIALGGDSAGGGLSLSLMLTLKERALPLPSCVVLFSPWTDLTVSGGSMESNKSTDAMFQQESIREGRHKYLNGAAPEAPLASPLFGDHTGLPPTLTFASKSEMLFDDSRRLHDKLLEKGVKSQFFDEDGLAHVWPFFNVWMPEAKKSIAQTGAFLRSHLGVPAPQRSSIMNPNIAKLGVAVVLDLLDLTIGRLPGFELLFDVILGVAAVVMFGWAGLFAFWEMIDMTGQADAFVPTLTLIALTQMRQKNKIDQEH